MANSKLKEADRPKTVAIACQGGGMHAAFTVGVLKVILERIQKSKAKFKLVGLSGTSSGALCALMVWYGLAPKKGFPGSGSAQTAIKTLEDFWAEFVASTGAETALNLITYGAFWAEEKKIPLLGLSAPIQRLNPYGALYKAVADRLPQLGVRKEYFDLEDLLAKVCPALHSHSIDWPRVETRVLIGATEVVNGVEAVFDSDCNMRAYRKTLKEPKVTHRWRQQLPLSLDGVAASGTLPTVREAEQIDGGYYWDGLYSQNPPVREFFAGTVEVPDELWIVRINPQQWPYVPKSNKDIQDRQNELMGNLSLNKELDFILTVNEWNKDYAGEKFANDHKHVTVRTIKMDKKTADDLSYSSKFDRSRAFMEQMSQKGRDAAENWLRCWEENSLKEYPEDAEF